MRQNGEKSLRRIMVWLFGFLLISVLTGKMNVKVYAAEENPLSGLAQAAGALLDAASQEAVVEGTEGTEETEGTEGAASAKREGIYSILLVGSDRRDDSWNGNSDTMILVTINSKTSQITMVSFMRDLGVEIPGNGTQKLNAAFAIGGISLLEETLQYNFGVQIDNYAAVDFYEMISIVDSLGGVDMEIRAEEVDNVNMYISSMCPYMGLNEYDYLLTSGGYLHLNGMQAVAFCRVRFVGDNDYERTERQRRVLSALFASFNPSNPEEMASLLKELLVDVDTDLTAVDFLKLAPLMMNLSAYQLNTGRIPFDGLYSSQGEMLMPSQPDTNEQLQQLLYG